MHHGSVSSALRCGKLYSGLLDALLGSALNGLNSFTGSGSLELPARYRLAFREFGVSIGLARRGKNAGNNQE